MVLVPTNRGTFADQAVVPDAMPEDPVELLHLIELTATLSLALPATASDEAVVEPMLNAGESIDSVGGTVSVAGVGVGFGVVGGVGGVGGVAGVVATLLP